MTDNLHGEPNRDDLGELLDSSFGDGPATVPAADRLAPARRALRRRRLASTGGAVVAVAAIATTIALMGGGDGSGRSRAIQPAAGPGEVTSSTPAVVPTPRVPGGVDRCATSDETGESVPALPDLPELPDLPDLPALPDQTVPADGDGFDDCPTQDDTSQSSGFGGAVEPVPTGESQLVRFTDVTGETLEARGAAEILAQSTDVDLPANFAGPDDRVAVAKVDDGGQVVYVLARQIQGSRAEYIATTDGRDRWPTIEDFLVHAAAKYDSGEGLR